MKIWSKMEVEHPYPLGSPGPPIVQLKIKGYGIRVVRWLRAGRDIPDYTGRPEALERHQQIFTRRTQ